MEHAVPQYGYVAYVEGVRHEIYAANVYAATVAARARYKGRKMRPDVSVFMCEKPDGTSVTHVADF